MTNRRNLLKGAAASALALGPVASSQARDFSPAMRWDKETDVVVVGLGGAGCAACIEAFDNGAKVIGLEKMPVAGGNTAVCVGGCVIPKNADHAYEYLLKTFDLCGSELDKDCVRAFCDGIVKIPEWYAYLDKGIELRAGGPANFPNLPHADTITKWYVKGPKNGGSNIVDNLLNQINKRGIEVLYETPAVELVRKGNEVVGVIARNKAGKDIAIKANRGVVLTTGGFEYDAESLNTFCQGTQVRGLGNPGNTGDGMRLAQSVGARLWHMTSYACPLGAKVPGLKSYVMVRPTAMRGFIWVNRDGNRFMNERDTDHHGWLYGVNTFDAYRHLYPAIPCYMIFDEKARLSGPATQLQFGYAQLREGFHWSQDCSQEIKMGIVKKADTLKELAKIIGVPADRLEASVARWNENIGKTGVDPDFGRRKEKLNKKTNVKLQLSDTIDQGPFYAIELEPALLNTQGGPRRNAKGQVLDLWNKPVGRLYSAGELGSIWGTIYQGSTNVAECLVFGRISGKNAALEKPWKA